MSAAGPLQVARHRSARCADRSWSAAATHRRRIVYVVLLATAALTACAEREQTAGGIKTHTAPFNGTNKPFVASGWKPGDRNSWEQQLKTRAQNGQNDYTKAN